jgi:hypothetical protein
MLIRVKCRIYPLSSPEYQSQKKSGQIEASAIQSQILKKDKQSSGSHLKESNHN